MPHTRLGCGARANPIFYALPRPFWKTERTEVAVSLKFQFRPLVDFPQPPIERMTRAGFPPTRVLAGTFLVTTEPAATTEFSPTVTPPMIVAPAAIHAFLSITIGFAIVNARRRDGSTGWPDVMMLTFGPIIASSAISSPPRS